MSIILLKEVQNQLDRNDVVIQPFFFIQVHPQEYQADMTAILGFVLKHDDSVNDRTEVNHGAAQKIIYDVSLSQ